MKKDLMGKLAEMVPLMLKYKTTQEQELFEQLMNNRNIKKLFTSLALKKINYAPTNLYNVDDLVSIAFIEMWKSINNYKFICPICKLKALNEKAYKKHVLKAHKKYIEPKPTLDKYILYNVGAYLQNSIRDEYSPKRKSNHTMNKISLSAAINEDADVGHEFYEIEKLFEHDETKGFEDEVIFKLAIDELIKLNNDEVSREIFDAYINRGMKNCDIADYFYHIGRYKTRQSAAVMVSRKIREIIGSAIDIFPELANSKKLS